MSHKASILSFFPNSTIEKQSVGTGYLATVASRQGQILMSEFGNTPKEAWRNAYTRIYQIWEPVIGHSEAAKLLVNANNGEGNGIHQGTMGS